MAKHLIILEGIATSGKTTILNKLQKELGQLYQIKVFSEDETLMTIVNNREFEVANALMNKLLAEFKSASADVILTDRYHFTHVFRTQKDLTSIFELEENLIKDFVPHIFLLTIQKEKIKERVEDARNRRKQWLGKEGTLEEKTKYYIDQQQRMLELAKQSKIPVTEIDSTQMNWPEIVNQIINEVGLKVAS